MPIYEYQCQECGKRMEAIQRLADAPLTTCPTCNGPLKKLISSPSFQFKGSGWYVTDYAKGSSGGANGAKSSDSKEGSKDKEAKSSESKDGGESGGSAKEAPAAPAPKAADSAKGD